MKTIKKIYMSWVKRWGKGSIALILTFSMLLTAVAIAVAAEFVVTLSDPEHLINGAYFNQFTPEDASGTGVFDSFLVIGANSEEVQGYNTDGVLEFEAKAQTESLLLSAVPYVLQDDVLYREFQLDINQLKSQPLISLDEVQIWLGGLEAKTITGFVPETVETDYGTFPGFPLHEVYNLDADEDNWLILDYTYNAGSGKRDLKLLVPDSYFGDYSENCEFMGTGCEEYVVFYSMFGIDEPNNDGFEEWGVEIYNIVKGYKWHDMDADGIWDAGEPGLEGWRICAEQEGYDPICTETKADGSYLLALPAGTYTITEECQSDWFQSYPAPIGGVCGTGTHEVTVNNGDLVEGKNFGNYQWIPDIEIDKTGDTLSKVGDSVNYTITITNTSSTGTPDLYCNVTDPLLSLDTNVTLATGASTILYPTYVVQEGDPDPLPNTASVSCTYVGDTMVQATDSDDHSVNLFQPSITFDKTGDTLSKVGDTVDYIITLTNTSSMDSPDLVCTITDAMLGISRPITLASGADPYVLYPTYTVQEGDPDPLINTASVSCSPAGFPNILTAQDTHSVNLFQPSITFDKTGDTLSKVGDLVNYTITLTNTSSSDSPNLECIITDTMLGISQPITLASGADSYVLNPTYTVLAGDPDPLVNTASVSCSPVGFPNILTAQDTHSVNLFQPSITFTKTAAETYSKAGDMVNYTITLTNTSSSDSPDLVCTITDTMLGINQPVTLASGDPAHVIYPTYTVLTGDPDPLVNTAYVSCSPGGFPNILEDNDSASVDLVHPAFTLSKTCIDEPVIAGEDATFQVVFANTGDVPLVVTFDEDLEGTDCPLTGVPVTVANGTSLTCTIDVASDTEPTASVVSNTVNAHVTLPVEYGLDNYWDPQASDTCDIYGIKSGTKWEDINADGMWDDMIEPVLPGWTIHFIEYLEPGFAGPIPVMTDEFGVYEFDMVKPGVTYAVCEVLEAGFMQTFPNVTLPAEGFVDCTQFGPAYGPVGYEIMLASGEYEFDNDFGNFKPLGCTYTQGYWKTHSMFGPAGPYDLTWDWKAGGDAIFLDPTWDTGFSWYEMFNTPPAGGNAYIILAHQYMAAWLNIHNIDPLKMANPSVLGTAFADAEALLGSYMPTDILEPAVREQFIMLAELLDDFNNGLLGVPHCED